MLEYNFQTAVNGSQTRLMLERVDTEVTVCYSRRETILSSELVRFGTNPSLGCPVRHLTLRHIENLNLQDFLKVLVSLEHISLQILVVKQMK